MKARPQDCDSQSLNLSMPGSTNVNRVFTLPRVATKQAGNTYKATCRPISSRRGEVDATANQGKQLGHLFSMLA
jgi:hypothetical protein